MKKIFATLLMMLSSLAFAEAPQMGEQIDRVAREIPTDNKDKIEVMELFWYGCIHCYHMDPVLNKWVAKLPQDVYFKRVPAIPNKSWVPMAKAFYAMETLGVTEQLHTALFDAVHKQKTLRPTNEKAIMAWIAASAKLDHKKVEGAFKSFSMNTQLNKAVQTFKASGATGVPSLIIDGKYITSSTMSGGNTQALSNADYIINNVRKDRNKAATTKK